MMDRRGSLLRALKMTYEQIHACPKGCVLFRKEYAEAKYCPKCNSSRFMEVDSGDGQKRQLDIPLTILRHLPFIPRIQRLYMTEESTKQMTWHKNGKRYNPDKMVHASDGEAWKHFDDIHREKAEEARNVRVALATDGFNPYGMSAAPYTCWPVFVIPINLPPGVCFQRQNIFVSLIIPGHPGNKMGVYMEPLIDELVRAWEEGVWTFDRATKTNFRMHVWYQYSMHDLPAYGLFCAWCVHGKFPCPVCKEALRFIWLKKGGKYSSFDKHRQFLPADHPFRLDIKNFTKGVVVTDRPPATMTGAEIRQQIDGLMANTEGGFVGYGEQHMWTHKSGLTRLPYYDDLLLPHNIDVMHTEKNVAEALWATIMDIPDKSKDNVKARVDLAALCDRPKLEMKPPEIRQQIDGLMANTEGGFVGYGEQHMWTHKSGLTRLPYYDDLLLPHNIDVMHTEKNVAEALWATIMDIPDKSKDNVKARVDLAALCDRPKLEMKPPSGGKTWRRPKADFVLSRAQRKEVLQWIKMLMFPDGYASNLSRG